MKTHRLLILALVLVAALGTYAEKKEKESSEKKSTTSNNPSDKADKLAKQLELTDVERAKVYAFYVISDAEFKETILTSDHLPSGKELQELQEKAKKKESLQLKKILPPEKYAKYKEIVDKQAEKKKKNKEEKESKEE